MGKTLEGHSAGATGRKLAAYLWPWYLTHHGKTGGRTTEKWDTCNGKRGEDSIGS